MPRFVSLKIFLRWVLAGLAYYSGALRLYRKLRQDGLPIILNYHRVSFPTEEEKASLPAMYVLPSTFEKHLSYLSRCYEIVTMERLMAWEENPENVGRPLCAITFDDGWSDNYHWGFPLLLKYRSPATLFLTTDFVDTDRVPWFYRLSQVLQTIANNVPGGVPADLGGTHLNDLPVALVQWLEASPTERTQLLARVVEAMKDLPGTQIEPIVDWLQTLVPVAAPNRNGTNLMLSWRQVQEMKENGIEIGSHGLSHLILTRISHAEAKSEINESKSVIEKRLEEPVRGFAYPNGAYTDEVTALVREAGYEYACTLIPGPVSPNCNRFQLRRILVHDDITFSVPMFACHIAGVFGSTLSRDPGFSPESATD